jgi:hypothetical protein
MATSTFLDCHNWDVPGPRIECCVWSLTPTHAPTRVPQPQRAWDAVRLAHTHPPSFARITGMTTKERLHELVDELSEPAAKRALKLVEKEREDPVVVAFRDAPEDDESLSAEDEAALEESHAELAAGVPLIPLEQVMRELGDA